MSLSSLLKEKASEARNNLSRVVGEKCRLVEVKGKEIIFSCPGKKKLRLSLSSGLQEGTYSLSTGYEGEDSDGFLQRDVSEREVGSLLTNPMIWSWTYRSFNVRFSQVLKGLIRLSYEKREAFPILRPLIEKALED